MLIGGNPASAAPSGPTAINTGLSRMNANGQVGARWAWADNEHLLLTTATEEFHSEPRAVTVFDRRSGKAVNLLSPAMLAGCRQDLEPLHAVMMGNFFAPGPQARVQMLRWSASPPSLTVDAQASDRLLRSLCRVEDDGAEFRRGNAAARDDKQLVGLLAPEHGSIGFDKWAYGEPAVKLYWYPPNQPKQALDATAADMLERPPQADVFRVRFLPHAGAYLLTTGGFVADWPAQTVVMTMLSTQGQVQVQRFPLPAALLAQARQDTSMVIQTLPIKAGALHLVSSGQPANAGVYVERQGRLTPRLCLPGAPAAGNCEIEADLESVSPDGCGLAFQALPARELLGQSFSRPLLQEAGTVHIADLCHDTVAPAPLRSPDKTLQGFQ